MVKLTELASSALVSGLRQMIPGALLSADHVQIGTFPFLLTFLTSQWLKPVPSPYIILFRQLSFLLCWTSGSKGSNSIPILFDLVPVGFPRTFFLLGSRSARVRSGAHSCPPGQSIFGSSPHVPVLVCSSDDILCGELFVLLRP